MFNISENSKSRIMARSFTHLPTLAHPLTGLSKIALSASRCVTELKQSVETWSLESRNNERGEEQDNDMSHLHHHPSHNVTAVAAVELRWCYPSQKPIIRWWRWWWLFRSVSLVMDSVGMNPTNQRGSCKELGLGIVFYSSFAIPSSIILL